MRPVNLTPGTERRGPVSAGGRTGLLPYVAVAALVLALAGVLGVVLFGNQVEDKRAEVASLEAEAVVAEQRAQALAPFVSFQQLRDARVQTIDSLARSRFDWERVVRELSKLIPKGVWLSNMTGTITPEVQVEDGAGISLRGTIPGPAIELVGCARSQPEIARLIAAVNDVDGVTRVAAVNGIKPSTAKDASTDASAEAEGDATGACPASAPAFQLVAAFDAVPVPAAAVGAVVTPPTPVAATPPASTDGEAEGPGTAEESSADGATPAAAGGVG